MRHLNKLFFALFLLPLFSIAQSNYKPGYVVTLKGDTVRGFIDFQEWDSNPTAISFKSAISDAKPQKFTIADIRFFDVGGMAAYRKYTCAISMDETTLTHLTSARDTSYKIDTVFLKVLQTGKNIALYLYTDALKTRFYVGEAPEYAPAELVYRVYNDTGTAANKEGNTAIENTYLKTLFALANKYNALDDKLSRIFETANYSQPDLMDIVSKINDISKAEYKKKYADPSKFNFYISAAVNISTTNSNDGAPYAIGGGGPYTSYLPVFSIGLNIIPNPNTAKVELRGELLFAETQFKSLYTLKVSPYVAEKANYDQLSISFIPQVIYNFYNAKNLKIYGGVGVAVSHFAFSNTFFGSQNPGVSDNNIGASNPYSFNSIDTSLELTAGVKVYGNFEIFGKFFTNTASTRGGYFQFVDSSKQIGVTYLFGK